MPTLAHHRYKSSDNNWFSGSKCENDGNNIKHSRNHLAYKDSGLSSSLDIILFTPTLNMHQVYLLAK